MAKTRKSYWKNFLKNLILRHFNETQSTHSQKILKNFDNEINNFYQVCSKEMLNKLENPISNNKSVDIAS